jgi:leader peptidase (prepilin peptidase)/N-methyltransferase
VPELVIQLSLITLLLACIPLTVIDIREHRLPNRITYPAIVVALAATLAATVSTRDWERLWLASLLNLGVTAVGVVLFLLKGFGLGDVKLLASLNQLLGFVSPWLVGFSLAIALVAASLYGITRLATGKLKWKDRIAFGPFLILGYAVCALPQIAAPTLY